MADLNFPTSPTVGQNYSLNNKTWTWSGTSWTVAPGGTTTSSVTNFTDTFTGNGSNTQFTISQSSTTNNSIVFVSGLGQLPTSAYSISGTTITFTAAIDNGVKVEVRTPSTYNTYSSPTSFTNYYFTATAAQTVVSGADNNAATLSYTVGSLSVFINGVKQVSGVDYTAANGSSITFTSALYLDDVVEITAYSSAVITAPSISIASVPSVTIGSVIFETVGLVTTTSTNQASLDVLDISLYRSAKYMMQITDTSNNLYHLCELLVLHDGTTAFITEYGAVYSSYSLMSFDASVSGSSLFVMGTPTNPNNNVKIYRVAVGI